jgi:hypothetical protein
MAGRLTKVGKAFYLFTMLGHPFPDSPVFTNSARSYLRCADFLMLAESISLHFSPPSFILSPIESHAITRRFVNIGALCPNVQASRLFLDTSSRRHQVIFQQH